MAGGRYLLLRATSQSKLRYAGRKSNAFYRSSREQGQVGGGGDPKQKREPQVAPSHLAAAVRTPIEFVLAKEGIRILGVRRPKTESRETDERSPSLY